MIFGAMSRFTSAFIHIHCKRFRSSWRECCDQLFHAQLVAYYYSNEFKQKVNNLRTPFFTYFTTAFILHLIMLSKRKKLTLKRHYQFFGSSFYIQLCCSSVVIHRWSHQNAACIYWYCRQHMVIWSQSYSMHRKQINRGLLQRNQTGNLTPCIISIAIGAQKDRFWFASDRQHSVIWSGSIALLQNVDWRSVVSPSPWSLIDRC